MVLPVEIPFLGQLCYITADAAARECSRTWSTLLKSFLFKTCHISHDTPVISIADQTRNTF